MRRRSQEEEAGREANDLAVVVVGTDQDLTAGTEEEKEEGGARVRRRGMDAAGRGVTAIVAVAAAAAATTATAAVGVGTAAAAEGTCGTTFASREGRRSRW